MNKLHQASEVVSAQDPLADEYPFSQLDLSPYVTSGEASLERGPVCNENFLNDLVCAGDPVQKLEFLFSGIDLTNKDVQSELSYFLHGGYNRFQIPQPGGEYTRYVATPIEAMFNIDRFRNSALKFISKLDHLMQVSLLDIDLGELPVIATLSQEELSTLDIRVVTTAISRYLSGIIPDEQNNTARRRIYPYKLLDECERYRNEMAPEDFANILSQRDPIRASSSLKEIPLWTQLIDYGGEAKEVAIDLLNYVLKEVPSEGIRILSGDGSHYLGSGLSRILNTDSLDHGWEHTHLKALFEGVQDSVVLSILENDAVISAKGGDPALDTRLVALREDMLLWIMDGMPDSLFLTLFFNDGQLANSVKPEFETHYFEELLTFGLTWTRPFLDRMAKLILADEEMDQVLYKLATNDPETYTLLVLNNDGSDLDVTTILRDKDGALSLSKLEDLLSRPDTTDVLLSLDLDTLMLACGALCHDAESARRVHSLIAGIFSRKIESQSLTTEDVPAIRFYSRAGLGSGRLRLSVVSLFTTIRSHIFDEIPDLEAHIAELERAFYINLTNLDVIWGVFSGEDASPVIVDNPGLHDMILPFVTGMFFEDNPFGYRSTKFRPSLVRNLFLSKLGDPGYTHNARLTDIVIRRIQRLSQSINNTSDPLEGRGVVDYDLDEAQELRRLDVLEADATRRIKGSPENLFEDLGDIDWGHGGMGIRVWSQAVKYTLIQIARNDPYTLRRLFSAYTGVKYGELGRHAQRFYDNFEELIVSAIKQS